MLMQLGQRFVYACHSPKVFLGELRIDPAVLHSREARHVQVMLFFGEPKVLLSPTWIEDV